MVTDVKSWIEERRAIHAEATPGEWEEDAVSGLEGCVYLADGSYECVADAMSTDDAGPIVDAHNMFPRALDAIEAVLKVHTPIEVNHAFKGRTNVCEQCSEDRLYALWPCETVEAIEGAINE